MGLLRTAAAILLLAAVTAARGDSDAAPRTLEGLRARAAELADGDPAARTALLRWISGASPRARRAALEALSAADAEPSPDALPAAVGALASEDPAVRAAAVELLVRFGDAAERALTAIHPDGAPSTPSPERIAHALAEVRRAAVEREFLSLWSSDDGSFHGMFDPLERHGPLASRVLVAIALDRRMRGDEVLPFGPYAWHRRPDSTRDRSEVRRRALDALGDVGDAAARELLRTSLRVSGPARRLFDDGDGDPVPAIMDDAMRHTIAALGDDGPLRELIRRVSTSGGRRSLFLQIVEGSREASAWIQIGRTSKDPGERRSAFDRAYGLLVQAVDARSGSDFLANDATDYYNVACVLAQRGAPGDTEKALEFLERSVDISPISSTWFERDGDLATLRSHPRFQALLERIRASERDPR